MGLHRRFPALVVSLVVSHGHAVAASGGVEVERAGALQVLADLTLIDGACRDVTVNFGRGFQFAAGQGLAVATVLPGGTQRSVFERVLRERGARFGHDELCGEIAENYVEALPGSVTRRVHRAGRLDGGADQVGPNR